MTLELSDAVPADLRRSWVVDAICPDLDLYSLYRARQLADPHRTALIDRRGPMCYTALDRAARSLAAGLARLGVRPGDVVGVQLPDGRSAVTADLALAALGAVALPFPVGRGVREAEQLLARSGAVAVLAAGEHRGIPHAAELTGLIGRLPALRHVIADGRGPVHDGAVALRELLRTDAAACVPARPDPESPARILVSSGSEGSPKMVAYSHNALAGGRGNFLASLLPPGAAPPRCLFLVPLASSFGSNGTSVTLARHGGTLVLLERFTAEDALAAVRDHAPTHVLAVPTMIKMMLARLAGDAAARELVPVAPTALVLGGSPLDAATAGAAGQAFRCPVVNLYGSADGVNCHTGLTGEPAAADGGAMVAGRPDPKVAEIRVVAPGGDTPLAPGEAGEIVARGPMSPLGYVGPPDLDARYRTPDGWVRTGDLGQLDEDGVLHVVGRLKDVVIRGGLNISPAETERELSAHPDVADVVCVGVPDPLMGERLAACVVPRHGTQPELAALCAHLTARGLARHSHPEHLLVLPELPLTPAGKPDRARLRQLVTARPAPR